MKYLKLSTSNQFALLDDEDYEKCNKHLWHATHKSIQTWVDGKVIILGRFLLNYEGCDTIDHEDRNFLNNQKQNLRIATYAQNSWNKGKKLKATSIYKGVNWNKGCQKWIARIMKNGKSIYLGCFNLEENAAMAYNRAARRHFGKFAALNIIRQNDGFRPNIHGAHETL